MPSVRSIDLTNGLRLIDAAGTKVITAATIPAQQDTLAKAEGWRNTWLAGQVNGYQAVVHLFSLNPLQLAIYTAELGRAIPANWWVG